MATYIWFSRNTIEVVGLGSTDVATSNVSKQKEGGGVNGCSLDVATILTVWEKSAEVQNLECE